MKLNIDNFGPLKNASFDIKKVNLFIGESGTGKSIITKIIYISNTFFRFFRPKNDKQTLSIIDLKADLLTAFENSYLDIFKDNYKTFKFTYFYSNENYVTVSKKKDEKLEIHFSDALNTTIEDFYSFYNSKLNELDNKIKEDELSLNIFRFVLRQEIAKIFTKEQYIYIPAGRSFFTLMSNNLFSILESGIDIDYIFTQFGTLFNQSKKEYGKYNKTFVDFESNFIKAQYKNLLKGSYYYIDNEDRFYINKSDYLQLNQMSSGQQELLPALVILWYILKSKKTTAIIIEEPEAHLFPKDQQRLIELLVYIFNQNNTQNRLIITTHSPYILSVLNNLIYAGKLNSTLIANDLHLKFDDISACALAKNTAESILNNENKLIDAEYIDDVSNEIALTFDKLLDEEFGA